MFFIVLIVFIVKFIIIERMCKPACEWNDALSYLTLLNENNLVKLIGLHINNPLPLHNILFILIFYPLKYFGIDVISIYHLMMVLHSCLLIPLFILYQKMKYDEDFLLSMIISICFVFSIYYLIFETTLIKNGYGLCILLFYFLVGQIMKKMEVEKWIKLLIDVLFSIFLYLFHFTTFLFFLFSITLHYAMIERKLIFKIPLLLFFIALLLLSIIGYYKFADPFTFTSEGIRKAYEQETIKSTLPLFSLFVLPMLYIITKMPLEREKTFLLTSLILFFIMYVAGCCTYYWRFHLFSMFITMLYFPNMLNKRNPAIMGIIVFILLFGIVTGYEIVKDERTSMRTTLEKATMIIKQHMDNKTKVFIPEKAMVWANLLDIEVPDEIIKHSVEEYECKNNRLLLFINIDAGNKTWEKEIGGKVIMNEEGICIIKCK